MQTVPEWFLDGMKADSRNIQCQIYLYDRPLHFLLLKHDDIESWDVVRELQDAGVPCAYLGQNIATVKIYNEDRKYQLNEEYRKYIKRGIKVRIRVLQQIPDSLGLFGPTVFTGWIDNFEYSEDGQFVTITAYDSLHYLKNQPSPWFRPSSSSQKSLYTILDYYFRLCHLEEINNIVEEEVHWYVGYRLDKNLSVKLRPLIDTSGTIGDVLQSIAQVGVCAIFCDAQDVLTVQLIPRTRHLVYQFDDMTQIFSSNSSTTGYDDYTHVTVDVYDTCSKMDYSLKRISETYNDDESIFTKGDNEYTELELRDSIYPAVIRTVTTTRMDQPNETSKEPAVNHAGPVVAMDTMPMLGSYLYVKAYDYAMDKVNVNIWAAKGIDAEFSVFSYDEGRTVGSIVESQEEEYEDSFFLMKKTLDINCTLMTDKAYAQQCATTYAKMISQSAHRIECSVRGEPSLELLDLVAISNPRAVHDAEQVLITRFHYTFDGSLACDLETLSYSTVMLLTYAFISPGFYIPYDAGAVYIIARCEPPDAGIVEGAGAYALGETTRLVVVPRTGWVLDHWENEYGKKIADGGHLISTVDGAATYIAVMREDATFITITVDVPEDNTTVELPVMSLTPVEGTIDWGDGSTEEYDATSEYDHRYEIAGTMKITLRAPIENLAFEIFRDNSAINTFTAGSQMLYMPAGMFYNSSVKNVNLLPAKNIVFRNSFSDIESYAYILNSVVRGVTKNSMQYYTVISTNAQQYSGTVHVNINALDASINIPKYFNGMLVNDVTFNNASKVVNINTPNSGINELNISNARNLISLNIHGPVSNINLANSINLTSLNIPNGLRSISIYNSRVKTMNINSAAPFIWTTMSSTSLTDIYLGSLTTRFDTAYMTTQLINVHIPDTLTDIHIHQTANLNFIPYNTDGGDEDGNS